MNDNLIQTKKRLTITFSVIVFCLILFLEVVYFSWKFYKEYQFEKNDFNSFIDFIEDESFDINVFLLWFDWIRKNVFKKWVNIWAPIEEIKELREKRWFKPQNFINFILVDSNKNIITSDIKDEIWNDLVTEALNNDKYFEITPKSEFLIKKIKISNTNHTLILFKNLRYSFSDYLEDLFWFVFISLLFSILLYIVWYRFVDRALKPVEANIKDMKDFIHNVWHELKTPLSVIDSNIQLINDMKKYDKDMTLELKNEVIKLNSLIDSLIKLTNIDLLKDTTEVNLKELVDEIISDFKYKINEKNIEIQTIIPKTTKVNTNKDYFYIFLANLIGNAIKYNKEKWSIDISYKSWILTIKDTWMWIKKADLPHIYDRFYKWDKSRNTEWFGIGLSLVKKIAEIYKWKVDYESEEWVGTKVKIKFS